MLSLAEPRPLLSPKPWLICLDLQREYVVPGRPRYAAANASVASTCQGVLATARENGWRVVHSQLRDGSPAHPLMFGAPIEGLRPLVREPVFFRHGLSAFANPAFASKLRDARGATVYLIGFSLADTCLATALAAMDAGLSLALVEDAVGAGAAEATAEAARAVLTPLLRLVPSWRLGAREPELAP